MTRRIFRFACGSELPQLCECMLDDGQLILSVAHGFQQIRYNRIIDRAVVGLQWPADGIQ